MGELAKQYDPSHYEADIYTRWEDSGAFKPDKKAVEAGKKPFVIMIPPPNVTGNLHMGHALQDTIMDTLIRYHRMLGEPTLWQPGTDHAALPTNALIEKQLKAEGLTKEQIGREKFMERVQAWYEQYGNIIVNQMKRLGASADWSRFKFTMDPDYIHAVQTAFVKYYEKGYIYRGNRIVNWDPKTQTTVSDLEIEWHPAKTPFYTFQYGPFQISTARPETKFGDKYVVMHPDDKRYAQYKDGEQFTAEWINGPITATVIKDNAVDPTFGTGVMTITPWHDVTDFQIAQRHNLDMEPIIDLQGKLLPVAGEFAGLPIEEARAKVVEKLQAKGLVVSIDENYEHNVARNERGQGLIEPQILRQWFVKMDQLKEQTKQALDEDLIHFHGPRQKKRLLQWIANEHDWTISRQIWLGQQIPVWWKPGIRGADDEMAEGNFIVSLEKPEGDWEQDPDVLDTWFSSALWSLVTLGWPETTPDLATYYPTSVLTTAQEILELWVHRMIFSGLELLQDSKYQRPELNQRIPFTEVVVHPTVLTKTGQRMSKSLGTGIDPLDLINQYGADATRFGLLLQLAYDKQAIRFDEEALKSARNFTNKLWNLARLLQSLPERPEVGEADPWIQLRFNQVLTSVNEDLVAYRLGEAAHTLYDFVWNEFADWYVEILKVEGSTIVARELLLSILKLLHPFLPYVTEVLWQKLEQSESGLLITASWPLISQEAVTESAELLTNMTRFQDIVRTIRSARNLLQIAPGIKLELQLEQAAILPQSLQALTKTTLVDQATAEMKKFPLVTGGLVSLGGSAITSDSITKAQERLQKELAELEQFVAKQTKVIAQMTGKAPAERIASQQQTLAAKQRRIEEIKRSLELLTL